MSEIKIGFFGETPVPEGEWIQAMGQDLFDRVRALAEDRDGWVERARRAEADRDLLQARVSEAKTLLEEAQRALAIVKGGEMGWAISR